MRKVHTASGAVAVQVMHEDGRRDVLVEHVESAHSDAELGVLLERAHGSRPGIRMSSIPFLPGRGLRD